MIMKRRSSMTGKWVRPEVKETMRRLYSEGMTLKQVAAVTGYHLTSVRRACLQAGIPMRKASSYNRSSLRACGRASACAGVGLLGSLRPR
jgi:hypothetical protein